MLGQSILELPTKFGMPLLEKIQKQVTEQELKKVKQEEVKDEPVSTVS
jgi:hypothetical protein